MTSKELQAALDQAGSMTGNPAAFHQDIQSRALVSIVALLEAGASTRISATASGRASDAKRLVEVRRLALASLEPFKRAMTANTSGGKKLKPDMVVMQIGNVAITGEDVARASDAYDELWTSR